MWAWPPTCGTVPGGRRGATGAWTATWSTSGPLSRCRLAVAASASGPPLQGGGGGRTGCDRCLDRDRSKHQSTTPPSRPCPPPLALSGPPGTHNREQVVPCGRGTHMRDCTRGKKGCDRCLDRDLVYQRAAKRCRLAVAASASGPPFRWGRRKNGCDQCLDRDRSKHQSTTPHHGLDRPTGTQWSLRVLSRNVVVVPTCGTVPEEDSMATFHAEGVCQRAAKRRRLAVAVAASVHPFRKERKNKERDRRLDRDQSKQQSTTPHHGLAPPPTGTQWAPGTHQSAIPMWAWPPTCGIVPGGRRGATGAWTATRSTSGPLSGAVWLSRPVPSVHPFRWGGEQAADEEGEDAEDDDDEDEEDEVDEEKTRRRSKKRTTMMKRMRWVRRRRGEGERRGRRRRRGGGGGL
ncbi:hypothetical protein FN846DRAFT_1022288 [Sphaerosporella brunnea]|uniref:Uncharacterized protein n=1 Tax=Sphaerosporella brunnea TaxID=1250544 RepID=A0A5J5EVB5_9PEZI|nr:hypothetical protein FN846DRAFT_1022288 [Sphaerosporella brunnea]